MLSNKVFDEVYTLVKEAIKDYSVTDDDGNISYPYEELNITRSIRDDAIADFPCLSVRQIGAIPIGNDLERKNQNAIESVFQIDSYSNISYDEAYELMDFAGETIMQLGYSLTYGIEEMSTMTYWRFVARFSRIVGANETLTL